MAEYWTSSFFAISMAEKKSRSIRTQKRLNELGQQRMFYMVKKKNFSCGTNAGSQSERRIRFILPARGFSRIKRMVIGQVLFWRF